MAKRSEVSAITPDAFFNAVIQLTAAMLPRASLTAGGDFTGVVGSENAASIVDLAITIAAGAVVEVNEALDADSFGGDVEGLVALGDING